MNRIENRGGMVLAAGLVLSVGAMAHGQIVNGSFETDGTTTLADGWVNFNNCFREPAGSTPTPRTGDRAVKMFGNFWGGFNVSGIFQDFVAQPGQEWRAGAYAFNCSCDAMGGPNGNFAVVNIEFRDTADGNIPPISFFSSEQVNAATPQDQWLLREVTATAPAGTTIARVVLLYVQPTGFDGGSVFWDDASMEIVPAGCPADLDNGSGNGVTDGGVDINDLLFFLSKFELGASQADLDNDGDPASGNPDGGVDINDLLFFLARFEAGC
jgi:hypothetical protein